MCYAAAEGSKSVRHRCAGLFSRCRTRAVPPPPQSMGEFLPESPSLPLLEESREKERRDDREVRYPDKVLLPKYIHTRTCTHARGGVTTCLLFHYRDILPKKTIKCKCVKLSKWDFSKYSHRILTEIIWNLYRHFWWQLTSAMKLHYSFIVYFYLLFITMYAKVAFTYKRQTLLDLQNISVDLYGNAYWRYGQKTECSQGSGAHSPSRACSNSLPTGVSDPTGEDFEEDY